MTDRSRIVVRNPRSGDGKRTRKARDLARDRGYEVLDSTGADHAVALAAEAANRAEVVVACGGDGTLNNTIQGVRDADRLDDVTLGVIPAGTGNDFADNIGIRGVTHAFDVIENGEARHLDLGVANGDPFLNSCVGGLTANASARTSSSLKRRLGVLAYVLTTFSLVRNFKALSLHVSAGPERDPVWSGDALMLLVGNGRRFPGEQMRQANMEDGLLNVVIIEDLPTLDYLSRGAADQLLRRGADYLTRLQVSHLHVTHEDTPAQFSLDGGMIEATELTADCDPGAMRFLVGPSYDPTPGRPE
jgi:YegS/Rv2252/BmrU family lipid kinase